MELCNQCEIVFTERECPLCVAKALIVLLEERVEKLEEDLKKEE